MEKKYFLFFIFLISLAISGIFLFAEKERGNEIIIITFQLDNNFKVIPYYYDPQWRIYKIIDFSKKLELFKTLEERWNFERAMDEYKKYLQKCHPDKKIR